jgi:hypothetical protein
MGAVDLVLVQDAELERIRWQRQRGVPQDRERMTIRFSSSTCQ